MDGLEYMQATYFSTCSNNAYSFQQKMEIITLICALSQRMIQAMPEKYKNCVDVLGNIFSICIDAQTPGLGGAIRSFGMICDDLLRGTTDMIPVPQEYKNGQQVRDKIYSYFTEEWAPF